MFFFVFQFFQGVLLLFFARGFVLFCDVLFSLLGVMFCFVFCEGFCFAMGFRFSVFCKFFFFVCGFVVFCFFLFLAKSFLLQVFFFCNGVCFLFFCHWFFNLFASGFVLMFS